MMMMMMMMMMMNVEGNYFRKITTPQRTKTGSTSILYKTSESPSRQAQFREYHTTNNRKYKATKSKSIASTKIRITTTGPNQTHRQYKKTTRQPEYAHTHTHTGFKVLLDCRTNP
eukprot:4175425-Karenia_brevis.AAC.1